MFKSKEIIAVITFQLNQAGVQVLETSYDGTTIAITTEDEDIAKEVLGWERFTKWIDDFEVIIF